MRKASAIIFAILLTTLSASAAPNDSTDRDPGVFHRIVLFLKHLMPHTFDTPQSTVPVP